MTSEALNGLVGFLERFSALIPPAQSLLVAIVFVMGLAFLISGIMGFVNASNMSSNGMMMMNQTRMYAIPLATFTTGIFFLSLSSLIASFLMSFFGVDQAASASDVFSYAPELLSPFESDSAKRIIIAILRVVQFLGLLGFVRGVFLCNKSVARPGEGYLGFGVTHMIGGIFAINIPEFLSQIQQLVLG